MNKKILTIRFIMVATAVTAIYMIVMHNQHLKTATFTPSSQEILLTTMAQVILNKEPEIIVQADEPVSRPTSKIIRSRKVVYSFALGFSRNQYEHYVPTHDLFTKTKAVVWSYNYDTQYGCVEFFSGLGEIHRIGLAGVDKKLLEDTLKKSEVHELGGTCGPIPGTPHLFLMDETQLENTMRFVSDGYVGIKNYVYQLNNPGMIIGSHVKAEGKVLQQRAREMIDIMAHKQGARRGVFWDIVLVATLLFMVADLSALYLLGSGSWSSRVSNTLRAYINGATVSQIKHQHLVQLEKARVVERRRSELVSRAARLGVQIDADKLEEATLTVEKVEAERREAAAHEEQERRAREARELFLAEAEKFGVREEAERLYDIGKVEQARELLRHLEAKVHRREQLSHLAQRVNALDSAEVQQRARDLLAQAEALLEAKDREWRIHIHQIEDLFNGKKQHST